MDSLQRCEVHFPGNAADVPWSAPAFPAHPYSQSAPSSHRLTVPSQPRAGLRDAEVSDWLRDVSSFTRTHMHMLIFFKFPPVNAVGNYRDEDWHMPPPVETAVGQGLPQDLRYAEYDVINDHPPIHEHCDRAINNAGDAVDPPARAQAAPPAPVCTGLAFLHHIFNQTFCRRILMVMLGALQLVLLEPFSMNGLPGAPSLFGRLMKSFGSLQCFMFVNQIHKLL